jgi:hypothetical protein
MCWLELGFVFASPLSDRPLLLVLLLLLDPHAATTTAHAAATARASVTRIGRI